MALDQDAVIACVGDNCVDAYLPADAGAGTPAAPQPAGGAPPVEVAGGNAFNVAVSLARAGRGAAYLGAVGDDPAAELIFDAARTAGLDTSRVVRMPGATGRTVVDRDARGERRFVAEDYGVAADYRLDAATVDWLADRRWVHFARQSDLRDWLEALGRGRAMLSCDLGIPGGLDDLERVAALMDVVFMSTAACERDTEALLAAALGAGAKLAVVTSGANGSVAAAHGSRWTAAAVAVDRVIDTLGAGDAYIAAFIDAHTRGMDVEEAMRAGAAAGAAACTRWGLAGPLQTDEVPV